MYRILLCLLLASCGVEQQIYDREKIEPIIADYIRDNPHIIAEAVERASQQDRAAVVMQLADNGQLISLGPEDAAITIIEFFDYNCSYCRKALDWVMGQLDAGARVIFVETPILDERNGTSKNAARAALAANLQNRYRDMHEALMQADNLQPDNIINIAGKLGLDTDRLQQDMTSTQIDTALDTARQLAEFARIRGTPGFFVNGEEVSGLDMEKLDRLVAKQ